MNGWEKRAMGCRLEGRILRSRPYTFVEADYYAVDGVSGKVAAFLDKVLAGTGVKAVTANHAYSQLTSALQCAVPTANPSFRNRKTAPFNTAPYYDSNAPPAAWGYLGNGAGATTYVVVSMASVGIVSCFAATTQTAVGNGVVLYQNGTGTDFRIYNAGANVLNTTVANAVVSTPYRYTWAVASAATPDATCTRNEASGTANYVGAGAPAGVPAGTLRIGANRAALFPMTCAFAMFLSYDRALTAAEDAMVRQYVYVKYGVAIA